MRTLIRNAIVVDATLTGLGVVSAGVLAGEVDTPAQRPFLVLRWGDTIPGLDTVDRKVLVIWVHDNPGSYSRIDSVIRGLKVLFRSMEADQHATGWLIKAEWVTDSGDLTDDGHGTIVRTTSFNFVSSGL